MKNDENQVNGAGSPGSDCSLSMSVYSGVMGGGAKRLSRLIGTHVKSGLFPRVAWKCPTCGGPLQMDDDGGMVRQSWRYSIGCREQDCQSVTGNSVKRVIAEWAKICKANKEL